MKNGLMWRKYVQWGVLQHVRGYIYTNDNIFYSLWWVVALFIMIGGYNECYGFLCKKRKGACKKENLGYINPLFFATILYTLYDNRFLNATEVLVRLLHFDATGPLYYV